MAPIAYFGINSSGLTLAVDLLILFVVVLYLSLIYWTYVDARRRIVDPMLIGCATAASLFPFVGTIIYLVLRPPEYLEDIHERELEMQAAEARLYQLDYNLCPHCDYQIERDFYVVPAACESSRSAARAVRDRLIKHGVSAPTARRMSRRRPTPAPHAPPAHPGEPRRLCRSTTARPARRSRLRGATDAAAEPISEDDETTAASRRRRALEGAGEDYETTVAARRRRALEGAGER